ncbi:hypothetical protein lse_0798 [Listeria seeligeri serovar 1/2b str. SLCC3954]|nr:hypothetical protein lse_0798 [Listeria seeligeri serovar 1/2b str. SLCC3954]
MLLLPYVYILIRAKKAQSSIASRLQVIFFT